MIATFFPLKKLRRNCKYLLFGAILLVGLVAVYHEMIAARALSDGMNIDAHGSSWRRAMLDQRAKGDHWLDGREEEEEEEEEEVVVLEKVSATWKWNPEYKGQANLHVFEDWCGGSTSRLRKNLHYPLYPHSRTTVQKLAVSPQWTNYGLRIFGYLHPYADGDFVFALSSDDNSEFWLSTDESPLHVELLARVGKTGTEWTAPGEFEKYASQTSRPARLSSQRRYFFEVIHKQNDRGNDHVEVAWKVLDRDFRFTIIESKYISLYVNESAFLMNDVAHIPQTVASHRRTPAKRRSDAADMMREDPRDSLYRVPLINGKFLQGVLPDCSYKPSYTIKDFPLLRYQGLQFVHMSYVYPNDYTRLTHMEKENSCFYPENPYYMKMFGYSRYMRLDRPGVQDTAPMEFNFRRRNAVLDEDDDYGGEDNPLEREAKPDQQLNNAIFSDYGDDYDDYVLKRRRKLFSLVKPGGGDALANSSDARPHVEKKPDVPDLPPQKALEPVRSAQTRAPQHERKPQELVRKIRRKKTKGKLKSAKRAKAKLPEKVLKPELTIPTPMLKNVEKPAADKRPEIPPEQLGYDQRPVQRARKSNNTHFQRLGGSELQQLDGEEALAPAPKPTAAKQRHIVNRERRFAAPTGDINRAFARLNQRDADRRRALREKEIEMNMPLQQDLENGIHGGRGDKGKLAVRRWDDRNDEQREEEQEELRRPPAGGEDEVRNRADGGDGDLWAVVDDEDMTPAPVFDAVVNWSQTFQVNHLDLQALRSDWIDLGCNISGNLLLHSSDALPMVSAFMERLNEKHHGQFTLVRVVNVEKRVDGLQGSRYLLELELKDAAGRLLRLSQYIYALIRHGPPPGKRLGLQHSNPQLVLCNPVGFRWNPAATVHFIVPVKNQARWVQQLITDMEDLFRATGDDNFNLIITDYNSTDMDVRKALEKSSLPRYNYLKLSGNFERSAGLQAGIDLIADNHSIVFLCDLHIQFPPSIIETIRKHCVEGYMAFAPIVMRLGCGATPAEARGYWEVNGFGLLGIYKSDLQAAGGMNTREFKDRWGGEDWELLDRILQAGLEVERIYLRNFFHHYHSKRGMWNRRTSSGQT